MGVVEGVHKKIGGATFLTNFVLLDMTKDDQTYHLLLGGPWLKSTKAIQDWSSDEFRLPLGSTSLEIDMTIG